MNQTVTAHISGIVFNIELEAYEKLQSYLNTIKGYFDESEGKEEIITDIESRIAELFKSKLNDSKEVITMVDVNEVIEIMGQPEDYIDEGSTTSEKRQYSQRKYRHRRIYRDPDDAVLGGVCSGIGYYIGVDPVWIRLAFLLTFLTLGFGLLLYIILWIVIPKANTASEKLEMRGEPINVSNIGKTMEDEMGKVKKNFNDFTRKANRQEFRSFFDGLETIVDRVGKLLFSFLSIVFRFLGYVLGFAFIVLALLVGQVLIAAIIGARPIISIVDEGVVYYSPFDILEKFTGTADQELIAIIGVCLIIGIPVLILLVTGLRLLFGLVFKARGLGAAAGILWIIGLMMVLASVFWIDSEFRKTDRIKNSETFSKVTAPIYLSLNKDMLESELYDEIDNQTFIRMNINGESEALIKVDQYLLSIDDSTTFYGFPELDIVLSDEGDVSLDVIKIASGNNRKLAKSNANSIDYSFEQQDSIIIFDPAFFIGDNNKFRKQEVQLELKIPEGQVIYLDESICNILNKYIENTSNYYGNEMGDAFWMMTDDGLEIIENSSLQE